MCKLLCTVPKKIIEQCENYSKLQINASLSFKHDCTVKTRCYRVPKQEF